MAFLGGGAETGRAERLSQVAATLQRFGDRSYPVLRGDRFAAALRASGPHTLARCPFGAGFCALSA